MLGDRLLRKLQGAGRLCGSDQPRVCYLFTFCFSGLSLRISQDMASASPRNLLLKQVHSPVHHLQVFLPRGKHLGRKGAKRDMCHS